MKPRSMLPLLALVVSLTIPSWATERHRMQLLVPADKLSEARALTSPLPRSPETVSQGKAIYVGKGACFRCHGKRVTVKDRWQPDWILTRNFQDQGFWIHRTEGELFW